LNVYEKYDVLVLAKDGPFYNLDMPVSEALQKRSTEFTGIHSCSLHDTLGQLLDSIKAGPVMRFVVLNDSKLVGILSLSDILGYLVK
jgi:5'-AMP-activated protein kinase regulatory gamma subunit